VNKDVWIEAMPFLAHVIGRIGEDGRYDTYESTKLDRISVGRVALVGDSANPMAPTLAQGAGCAIMNALGLAVAIDEAGDDLAGGLEAWARRERPLTEHTQDISALYIRTRAGSDGANKWDATAMRTARHVPTGTEHIAF
jgi:2-methyl-3-hydroxypyridine 5-carboxylic acid dioxygenase